MTAILAGPGDFLPVIFVLIAIASGIINFIKERKAAAEREGVNAGGWKGGNANPELQSEIDAFLEEVSPDRSDSPRRPRRSESHQRRRKKVVSDEEAERRRKLRARRERDRRQKDSGRRRQTVGSRKPDTQKLDGVSSRHVESSVENRHLQPHILDSSTSDFLSENQARPIEASRIVSMLQQPDGIRNAILLGEILGPPVAQRPDRKQFRR